MKNTSPPKKTSSPKQSYLNVTKPLESTASLLETQRPNSDVKARGGVQKGEHRLRQTPQEMTWFLRQISSNGVRQNEGTEL